ncbi:MAG TPA: glycoside hydrolase family 20 zincin-like fold domain-containing protein, partial [Pyrinomonadaceae bacterium]|nr:glycoside hydrolase family 20 zincin-like fold domain-containing protein [Pyrinomonadaceae bacterium]
MTTKKYLVFLVVLTCVSVCVASASVARAQQPAPTPAINLMPMPASVKFNGDRLAVNDSFKVATRGHSDDRLKAAIARFVKRLEGRTVLTLAPGLAVDDQMTQLIVHCDGAGKSVPSVSENETYRIDITDRQAILKAPTVVGAIRGLETVLQLLNADRNGYFFPGVVVEDQPRFPWRGLLIDVARHFQTMETLKRN